MTDVAEPLEKLRKYSQTTFDRASKKMLDDLDQRVPVGRRNFGRPKLKTSRRVNKSISDSHFSMTVEYPTMIANYTDEGTKAHIIRPRRARVLAFPGYGKGGFGRSRGGTIFAMVVHHPGTKGTKWWSQTMRLANWSAALKSAAQ